MRTCRALILGIGGQDGSYLTEILLGRGWEVHGLYRRSSSDNLWRIRHLIGVEGKRHHPECWTGDRDCHSCCPKDQAERLVLHRGDMADPQSIDRVIRESDPDLLFNEADQDDAGWSGDIAAYSIDITAGAVGRLLESVCRYNRDSGREGTASIRVFQPCSALMFGNAPPPQNEQTPFSPTSVFACAKVAAYYLCQHYRREHIVHVSTGILFNHDSPARSADYVLHKICRAAVWIATGKQKILTLGNLDQRIDIGYARDYMEAAVAILELPAPGDYVIGTGQGYSIGEMVDLAFQSAGLEAPKEEYVRLDPAFNREGPRPTLIADTSALGNATGWVPRMDLKALIDLIVDHERHKLLSTLV